MKNKKILLIICALFLLTGCTPKITYEILNGDVTEQIDITLDNSISDEEIVNNLKYYLSNMDKYEYNIEPIEGYKNVTVKAKESKDFENLETDRNLYLNRCFDIVYIENTDKKYTLNTSKKFKCIMFEDMIFDSVDVSIKTYNKVYENNADEVDNITYTWHFDSSNYTDKNITIVLGNGKYVWYYKFRYLFASIAVVAIIVFIVLFVINSFKNSSNRANRM